MLFSMPHFPHLYACGRPYIIALDTGDSTLIGGGSTLTGAGGCCGGNAGGGNTGGGNAGGGNAGGGNVCSTGGDCNTGGGSDCNASNCCKADCGSDRNACTCKAGVGSDRNPSSCKADDTLGSYTTGFDIERERAKTKKPDRGANSENLRKFTKSEIGVRVPGKL